MTRFRLAAAALNQTPLDWTVNRRHILAAVARVREEGVGVLCLPELCITGYGCEDMFFSAGVQQTALEELAAIVPECGGLVVCVGLPVKHEGLLYNTAAMICDGRLIGIVAKQFLAGDGIHYEPRWFHRWPAGKVGSIDVAGQPCLVGDLTFDCGGVRLGMEICRDAWVAERTGKQLARRGVDVILNPSASHFAFAKQRIRERLVLDGSREFAVSYAYANLLGNEAGRAIYDGGTLLAAGGKMFARGPRFSYADWVLTSAVVEVIGLCTAGGEPNSIAAEFEFPAVAELIGTATVTKGLCSEFHAKGTLIEGAMPGHPDWETSPHWKEEEFARAVPLALFDYLRRSRAQGLVVSLSGGVDSSTVAVLVHLMVHMAGRELGLEQLIEKLGHIADLREALAAGDDVFDRHARHIMAKLLTCVYQATRNSSDTTLRAARTVADAIGAEFLHWNVDKLVDRYVEIVAKAMGRPITWEQDDLALQNIQARVRGPGAWLLANLDQALLLTTSNRSEAAVGYATMDGDTCGGLAPIAGIDKAFLRDWLRWLEATGPAGVGPLLAMAIVNAQEPTAELRPADAAQTDEGDLMPYRVLDAIERAAIRDKKLPVPVWQTVCDRFPEYDRRQMGTWVERFFTLWCRNQWKRERYAPSFHLDDENLDPKTWCRFPILNSGFERELEELRQQLGG